MTPRSSAPHRPAPRRPAPRRPVHSRPAHRSVPAAARVSIALTGSLLAGVLTSFGQAVPALATVANSAGPWFVVAVALCLLAGVRAGRVGTPLAMLLGIASLELMHIGYWATSNLRGYPDVLSITNFWVLMGIVAGVLAGGVAVTLRSTDDRWRAGAVGVVAAVLVGEGVRAVLRVADQQTIAGWVAEIVVGAVLLVIAVVIARTSVGRVVGLGVGVVGAVGVLGAYLVLGG